MAQLADRDAALDSVAVVESYLRGDREAVIAVIECCNAADVASMLGWLLAGVLEGLAERDGSDPARLLAGLADMRDAVLSGGD